MSKPYFLGKMKIFQVVICWNFLPSMLSINTILMYFVTNIEKPTGFTKILQNLSVLKLSCYTVLLTVTNYICLSSCIINLLYHSSKYKDYPEKNIFSYFFTKTCLGYLLEVLGETFLMSTYNKEKEEKISISYVWKKSAFIWTSEALDIQEIIFLYCELSSNNAWCYRANCEVLIHDSEAGVN